MIQRYSCDPETPGPCDHGGWVLFTDAEADKAKAVAEAVEKATAEVRAELVEMLEDVVREKAHRQCDGWWRASAGRPFTAAERLVELGTWRSYFHDNETLYRTNKSQSSGEPDETTPS